MRFPLHRGFTLIELMIVIAITGILATFALPSYSEWMLKNRRLDYLRNIGSFQLEQQRYRNIYGKYAMNVNSSNNCTPSNSQMCWTSSFSYLSVTSPITVTQETYTAEFTVTGDPSCSKYSISGGYGTTIVKVNDVVLQPGSYDKCYPLQ